MRIAWEGRELYCHISTKAGFDPVKTLYVCAPGADAASYEAAARFAQASGWREIAEQDGAVLVLPIVPYGWRAEDAGLLMVIASYLIGLDGKNAFRIVRRDHANHKSPNCAWSESAAAGALHIQLGGTHNYFGKPVEKPTIGDADRPAERADIRRANRLLYASSSLMMALIVLIAIAR